MLSKLINRPCTVINRSSAGGIDELGNETATESYVQTVCEIQQRTRAETEGDWSKSEWIAYLPAGTDLSSGDAVVVDDGVYEVVGDPWPARNPRTQRDSHIEATLGRKRGSEDVS